MKWKRLVSLLFTVLLVFSLTRFVSSQPEEHYFISVQSGNSYYLKGETGQIIIQSNASTTVNLKIYNPLDILLYNQDRVTNSTGINILNLPVQKSVLYGDYRVVATAPDGSIATCWFSVPNVEDWIPTSFPFVKEHKGLTHLIFGNKTLVVTSLLNETISITMPDLPSGVTINSYYTEDAFVARFRHEGLGLAVDMSFLYIYKGAKLIINGTFDEPKDFSFEFASPRQIKKALNSLRDGHLVFDWSDLAKHAHHFSYDHNTKKLTVTDLPQTFSIDPEIFSDGFESGDFSAWTGTVTGGSGSATVQSTIKHHGTYAAKFSIGAASADSAYAYKDFAGQTTIFGRIYLQLSDLPTSGDYFTVLRFSVGATKVGQINIKNIGGTMNIQLRRYYPDDVTSDAIITMLADTWYYVELKFVKHASTGEYRAYWEGVEEIAMTGLDTSGAPDVTRVNVGVVYENEAGARDLYVDCVVVSDAYIGTEAEESIEYFYGVINQTFTVNGAANIYKAIHYLYGAINQTFTINSLFASSVILNLYGSIAELFTINSITQISSDILSFYGAIAVLFGIDGITDLPVPTLDEGDYWVIGFTFAIIAIAMAVSIGFIARKKNEE